MEKRVICCIGDSLTEGDYGMYGVTGVANVHEKNYPYFLAKELKCETRNYGRCGLRADQYLDYYMENNLDMSDADIVMIMLGTNGGHSVTEDTVPNESYKKLIKVIQKDAPKAKVILVTPPYVTANPEFANHWYRTHVEVSVEFVRNVAEQEDVYLIDAAKYEEFNEETVKIYQKNDGLHYVEEGYQEMARFFVSAKYSCGFSNTLISSIIVGERYLDYFTTITEDRLWQLLAKPVLRWRNRSGLSMNAAKAV